MLVHGVTLSGRYQFNELTVPNYLRVPANAAHIPTMQSLAFRHSPVWKSDGGKQAASFIDVSGYNIFISSPPKDLFDSPTQIEPVDPALVKFL
jgi:hypothetical protein